MIDKKTRALVYKKYSGKCAYCGSSILENRFQVDHIKPKWHSYTEEDKTRFNIVSGTDDIENLNPACIRCNKWKSTFSIEQFRREIQLQIERLNLRSPNYRLAKDFNLLKESEIKVKFYFETIINQ